MRYVFLCGVLFLVGCGPLTDTAHEEPKSYTEEYSLEAVKLISPSISRGEEGAPNSPTSYELGSERRLLMRYEKLRDHVDKIDVRDKKVVVLEVTLVDPATRNIAIASLRLCPLLKNWMMLATWKNAHPYETWSTPGADYDESECVRADLVRSTGAKLQFDITRWFVNYPKGRSTNYGFTLIASGPVRLVGTKSGSNSPRMQFDKLLEKKYYYSR